MAAGRYTFVPKLFNFKSYATSDLIAKIFFAVDNGTIATSTHIVKQGERLGMIRFGSRVDIYFSQRNIMVKVGQNVIAGESLIARK